MHLFVNPADIIAALTLLRDGYQFELLSALTAMDYWPQQTPRFHVIYQFTSLARNTTLQLRVPVDGTDPRIPTATGVYEVPTGVSASSRTCSASFPKATPIRASSDA